MRFVSLLGVAVLLFLAFLMSNNRRAIRPRIILWGIGLQLLFAAIILGGKALSSTGMFVFLSLILLYLFAEQIQNAGELPRKIGMSAAVIAGGAAVAAAGYFLDQVGVATIASLLLFVTILYAGYAKLTTLRHFLTGGFLAVGFGIIQAREITGQDIMANISGKVDQFLQLTNYGTGFLFGNIVSPTFRDQFGFQFALGALPTIIFFAAFMSIMYHFGVIQIIIQGMTKFMRWTMGTSGAETLSCTSNIFVGQTEAPLLIKPFLQKMTLSELTTIMVGGFATIAGGVLALYISFGIDPGHLIAASVMSAPAALVIGKIIFPETETSETMGDDVKMPEIQKTDNVIEAASNGITDGLKLAVNVAAMLLGFIALVALLDVILNFFDSIIDGQLLGGAMVPVAANPYSPVTEQHLGIFPGSLSVLFGHVFKYLAFVMGTPWQDSEAVGNLLGLKLSVNELVAYTTLGTYKAANEISMRAEIISTYALCGFANFASIGIQLGGISAIAPERKKDLAKVGFKAMLGGAIASWITASIAGLIL